MRQIFLDTETTGLEHKHGHRVLELAGVEMVNRRLTNRHLHFYINPERDSDPGALAVHGITTEFLADKPKFAEIAAEFLDFVRDAELVIHNAPFDIGFLNAELNRLDLPLLSEVCAGVCDTLKMAKELHPGKKNNLNALCDRYFVDNSHRTLHGALLDAEILAEVYLGMTRGQESLIMALDEPQENANALDITSFERRPVKIVRADEAESAAHAKILETIQKDSKGKCLWLAEPAAE